MIINRDRPAGAPPHGIIFSAVIVIVVLLPFLIGDGGEAITEAITELLSPLGLLLLPIALLLTIQFLSTDHGGSIFTGIFTAGEPDRAIRGGSGSPVGVALFLAVLLFLLYSRIFIFGGGDDNSGD